MCAAHLMKTTKQQVVHFLSHVRSTIPPEHMVEVLGKIRARRSFWCAAAYSSVIAIITMRVVNLGWFDQGLMLYYAAIAVVVISSLVAVLTLAVGLVNDSYLHNPSNYWPYLCSEKFIARRREFAKLFGTKRLPDENYVKVRMAVQALADVGQGEVSNTHKRMLDCAAHFVPVPSLDESQRLARVAGIKRSSGLRRCVLQKTVD